MSRRSRKTDHGITDYNGLLSAIKQVKINKKSIKATARDYNIPGTSFLRYIKKIDDEFPDITKVSDDELLKNIKRIASYSKLSMV